MDPVAPRQFSKDKAGRGVVDVHPVVRDCAGTIITDQVRMA